MEKADPDDLSVEVTTFDEEESSTSMMESDAGRRQQEHHYSGGSNLTTHTPPPTTIKKEDSPGPIWFFEELRQLPKEIRNIIAGGFAGMIAKSVVAPFDRIKILYQVSSAKFRITKLPGTAKRIIQEEGLSALWKGNTATLIRVFPYSGIQFMIFDRCKTYILREQERRFLQEKEIQPGTPKPNWGLSPLESMFAGMAAGAVSVIATYPLDLTRAQLAVLKMKKGRSSTNVGFAAALLNNYRDRGVTGLFRGITPTLLGILPYSGLAFSFNEQAKRKVRGVEQAYIISAIFFQFNCVNNVLLDCIRKLLRLFIRRSDLPLFFVVLLRNFHVLGYATEHAEHLNLSDSTHHGSRFDNH